MGELGKYLPYEGRSSAVHRSVLPADSWIHVFLCCGDFRSGRGCRQYEKYGGFIPGVRAGKPTERYLSYVLTRITLPGSLYLAVVSMIPLVALVLFNANQNFPFGGASLLIVVGVGLDTLKQVSAQLQQRNYEGLLR